MPVGLEGQVSQFPDDLQLSAAARFVCSGGAWTWRGQSDPKAILTWTADRIEEVAGGDVLPLGKVLADLLRMRAETM